MRLACAALAATSANLILADCVIDAVLQIKSSSLALKAGLDSLSSLARPYWMLQRKKAL